MSISFAGIGLEPATEHDSEAAFYWHGHRVDSWSYQGYTVPGIQHLPLPFWPMREPPRLGVLNWPTGADRWATFHLLVTGAQLTSVLAAIGNTPASYPLVITDGNGGTITANMWLLPERPVSQRGDGKEYYLLTFVDDRWFWWMTGGKTTPVNAPDWGTLLTQLCSSMGVTPALDFGGIPAAYLTPNPARWTIGVQPLPMVLEAAARTIGGRCVRQVTGNFLVTGYTDAAAADASRWTTIKNLVLAGGQTATRDIALSFPASVDTVFFDGTSVNVTLASIALPAVSGVTGVPGRIGRVTADPAQPGTAQKANYAAQATIDYYTWGLSQTDCTLVGFQNVTITGLDQCVEWVHHPAGMVTRIIRPPWSDRNLYGECGPLVRACGGGSGSGSGPTPGPGSPPEYSVECVNGTLTLQQAVLSLTAEGLSQTSYTYSMNLNIPCTGGISGSGLSGSGAPFPIPPPAGTLTNIVQLVCPVLGHIEYVTSNYPASFLDDIIFINASGVIVVLPNPVLGNGPGADQLIIKMVSTGTATVFGGAATIDSASTVTLNQWDSIIVVNDGVNWFTIASN